MNAYQELIVLAVPTREAGALMGLSRTTIYRKPATPDSYPGTQPQPNGRLTHLGTA